MYDRWTEIAVYLRNFLWFIWDLYDAFTVHNFSARTQIQYSKSSLIVQFGGMILRISFIKVIQNDKEKFLQ